MFKDENDRLRAGVLPTDHREGTKEARSDWPELIPLDTPQVPTFPTEVLPAWQRNLVEAAATETETAPDLGALAVLSAQATALQRKLMVEQRPGFFQPLALWTLSLLKSGGRKSRVFQLATEPLQLWQARKGEELRARIATEASARRRLEQRLRRAEKAAADAQDPDKRRTEEAAANEMAEELANFVVARPPLLFVTEGTPERLEEMLCEYGGRMAVLSDENAMIELLSGRYSHGAPHLSSLNAAHDGGRIRVGRKRRQDGTPGDRMEEHALVTFGLSVQPDRLFSELREHSAFFESGFAWRFLFALVRSTLGDRTHRTPSTSDQVRLDYRDGLLRMLDLPIPEGLDFPILHLDSEATEALWDWEAVVHEPRLRPVGDLSTLESWGSKLASRLCRIAALFHCAECPTDPWETRMSLDTMQRALSLAPYFIAHAKAVAFELNADPDMHRARRAVAWLRREQLDRFSRRDLHKAVANNDAAKVLDRPLAILEERGFIRPAPKESGQTGRPSLEFMLNPLALTGA